jgi:type IV secretion system protein VirB10
MTAAAPDLAPPAVLPAQPVDHHEPKLAPDDPRLRLGWPGARTLRTAPLILIGAVVIAASALAVAFAVQPPKTNGPARGEPSGMPAPPVIPETIRNASAAPSAPRARPDAGDLGGPAANLRAGGPSAEELRRRAQEEADVKAQTAGVLFEERQEPIAREPGAPAAPPLEGPASGALPSADSDPNGQNRKNAFLEMLGAKDSNYLSAHIEHPRSPYEVKAGTIIPAVLLTAINSDLPGPVIGQVREHVYDSVSGNTLLIPQGSRLLAHYDSMVAWGQERVLVCWNRLLFPNGDSIRLECMPAADLQGAAGLTDEVDEHWGRILKGAAVSSLLAATTTAVAGNTQGFQPTVPQVMARNAAEDINQVGQQITRRNLMIQPTITVRPGFSVNVIVNKDIVLQPYPSSAAGGTR